MGLDRSLVAKVRELDQYDLRRLMILARGLLLHADDVIDADGDGDGDGHEPPGGDAATSGVVVAGQRVTYRQELVKCGKRGCTTCPHGPYWYGYFKQDGRTRSQYIGRHLPGQELERFEPSSNASDGPPPDGQTAG